jgi:putative tricarboxylic transport membrane protein
VRPEDLLIAGLCLLAAAVAAAESVPRYFGRQGIGPGAFPTWVAILLVCCATGVIVKAARQRGLASWEAWPRGAALRRVLLASASLILYLAVLGVLGFWLASSFLLLFYLRVLGRYSWPVAVAVAFGAALLIAYVFGVLLFMPLPPGFVGI